MEAKKPWKQSPYFRPRPLRIVPICKTWANCIEGDDPGSLEILNPRQIIVHGYAVVDGGVKVEAPPGHAVYTDTVCPGAGVQVEDFKNGKFGVKSEKPFLLKAGVVLAKIRIARLLEDVDWAI